MDQISYTPRWLHQRIKIPAGEFVRMDPGVFANTEMWPWALHWMSVTGTVVLDTGEPDYEYDQTVGGVARRLLFEVGHSQYGDINLVYGMTDAFLGSNEAQLNHWDVVDQACKFKFPVPYSLAPDTGIIAEVQSLNSSAIAIWNPGIIINGYHEHTKSPRETAMLGGYIKSTTTKYLANNATAKIRYADMFNDGRTPMKLYEMMLTPGAFRCSVDSQTRYTTLYKYQALNELAWRINPSSGVPWMPRPAPIPVGNIAPFNRGIWDFNDVGPRSYMFPPNTVLEPKQRLGVKVGNMSASDQTIDVCVFGLLEVS